MMGCHLLALLLAVGSLVSSVQGQPGGTIPLPGTGTPNCILPITQLICTVDSRSGFVAGIQYANKGGVRADEFKQGPAGRIMAGPVYGTISICSRGPFSRYNRIPYAPVIEQTVWDMTDPNDPNFPTNSTNQPNLDYYYPYGGLITQMIVLQAKNPYGDSFGTVAAAIFRYHANTTGYGFAVCGNARYANAYLRPLSSPPPPTVPMLQSQFVNPLSATNPGLFLAKFSGVCSTRGYGYLGGDPQTQSIYHVKYFTDPCFAAPANVTPYIPEPPAPRPEVQYGWDVPHKPCYWDKKDSQKSASISCALTGEVVATGRYGVIMVGRDGKPVEAFPGSDGKMQVVPYDSSVYQDLLSGLGR